MLEYIGRFVLGTIATVFNGWTLTVLWGWFIAPTFGLPYFSVPIACGISVMVRFLTTPFIVDDNVKYNKNLSLGLTFILPLTTLTMGGIYHLVSLYWR